MFWRLLLVAVPAYLLGCISTGLILSRREKVDIRSLGSKSTGATNMTRVMGLRLGLATFLGDFLKAVLAVLLGLWVASSVGGMVAGLAVVLGHNWPVFYRFKGGKGVACSIAVLFLMVPMEAAIAGALGILAIVLTKYVSLGSLVFLGVSALLIPFTKGIWPYGVWGIVLFLIAAYRHRSNIGRLIEGKENKFTMSKPT